MEEIYTEICQKKMQETGRIYKKTIVKQINWLHKRFFLCVFGVKDEWSDFDFDDKKSSFHNFKYLIDVNKIYVELIPDKVFKLKKVLNFILDKKMIKNWTIMHNASENEWICSKFIKLDIFLSWSEMEIYWENIIRYCAWSSN